MAINPDRFDKLFTSMMVRYCNNPDKLDKMITYLRTAVDHMTIYLMPLDWH